MEELCYRCGKNKHLTQVQSEVLSIVGWSSIIYLACKCEPETQDQLPLFPGEKALLDGEE